MAGSHVAHRTASNSKWKVILLIVILLVVIAALGFLLWQLFGDEIATRLGIGGNDTPTVAEGIVTEIKAEYGNGRNMGGSITVSQGTLRPADVPEDADVVLLDINWTGKKAMSEPLYITVSDPSFPDGDGLAVYHCDNSGQWNLIGTYVIREHAVTFLTESLSPFAFQVISAEPEPVATPEPIATAEPTATPEPTPEPTPAPIQAVDYGAYTAVQTGAFSMVNEMEDEQTYVMALVNNLPEGALTMPVEEEEDSDEDEDENAPTLTYVEAPDAEPAAEEAGAVAITPTASVLVNLDGTNLGLIDMTLVQAEDGTWCLSGPVTEGMLWESDRDAYKDERRYSLENNDCYLNLDDDDQNVILNDNHVRTRWLIQPATLANGSQITTLNYRNDDRFYVSQLAKVAETLPGGAPAVTATQAPDGTTPETSASGPVYLGMAAPADTTAIREALRFTVTTDEAQAQQLVLFKLNEELTPPAGVITTLEHSIIVPEITEETNLSTLVIRDGDKFLQLGVDYTINARVYNDSVVVIIQFMGQYTGQIVRSYPGTTILTNDMRLTTPTPAPSVSPIPSPSPTPYTGGEGSNVPSGGGGGGGGGTSPNPPATVTEQPTQPASGTDATEPEPIGDPSDTNT